MEGQSFQKFQASYVHITVSAVPPEVKEYIINDQYFFPNTEVGKPFTTDDH